MIAHSILSKFSPRHKIFIQELQRRKGGFQDQRGFRRLSFLPPGLMFLKSPPKRKNCVKNILYAWVNFIVVTLDSFRRLKTRGKTLKVGDIIRFTKIQLPLPPQESNQRKPKKVRLLEADTKTSAFSPKSKSYIVLLVFKNYPKILFAYSSHK